MPAAAIMVLTMMITCRIFLILQISSQQRIHCPVRIAAASAEETDSHCLQRILCTHADAAADQRIRPKA